MVIFNVKTVFRNFKMAVLNLHMGIFNVKTVVPNMKIGAK